MLKAALVGFYNMHEGNPWEIIKKLSGWGYKAYESAHFLLDGNVKENLKKLADLDFSALSIGLGRYDIGKYDPGEKLEKAIEDAQTVGVKYINCYWSGPQSYDEALETAEDFNNAGEKIRAAGLTFCYHNHEHEFKDSFNGVRYFDLLMANTSPENFCLVLDLAWATLGVGTESVPELIHRVKDRIKLAHFKDLYDFGDRNSFTALGTGKVDIHGLVKEIGNNTDVEYVTVEQDQLRNLNADDTVLLSYLTLKESGLVE